MQKYIDSLGIFSDENIGERLFDYIRGEKFDYGRFGEQILGVLFEDVKNMLPAFACICAVALLCGILSSVKSSFADPVSYTHLAFDSIKGRLFCLYITIENSTLGKGDFNYGRKTGKH